jgi:hypothetical protein
MSLNVFNFMGQKHITQWIEGFVDDTSIFTNTSLTRNNIQELKEKLRQDGTYWAGLLEASGGKLELVKCFFYLLTWRWDKHGDAHPQYMADQEGSDESIILTTLDGNQQEINQLENTL